MHLVTYRQGIDRNSCRHSDDFARVPGFDDRIELIPVKPVEKMRVKGIGPIVFDASWSWLDRLVKRGSLWIFRCRLLIRTP